MPTITIQGTVIEIPDSAQSPNWAPPIIEAFQAIADALSSVVGEFDIPPKIMDIDAYNPGININITDGSTSLAFPTSDVRGAFVRYSVFRTTSTDTAYETGELMVVYNPNGPNGNKWEVAREYVGDGLITFYMTDTGQIQFTTTAMGGINHEGRLTFLAQAVLQDN